MKTSLLAVSALALTALSSSPVFAKAKKVQDCREAFTKNYTVDSRAVFLSLDDVPALGDELTLEAAKAAVFAAAKKLGCDASTLKIAPDADSFGGVQNGCAEIVPGINLSKACYVATDDSGPGYFLVHATLPEGLTVSFSRWD